MPVTDLTNTTWILNETLDFSTFGLASYMYYVNFTTSVSTYSRILISHSSAGNGYLYYGSTVVYQEKNNVKWKNAQQRFVTFTGGTYVTDATLIAWIEANAQRFYTPYRVTENDLTAVADTIRTKGGTSESLEFPSGFVDAIQNITTPIPSNYGRIEYDGSILTVS